MPGFRGGRSIFPEIEAVLLSGLDDYFLEIVGFYCEGEAVQTVTNQTWQCFWQNLTVSLLNWYTNIKLATISL